MDSQIINSQIHLPNHQNELQSLLKSFNIPPPLPKKIHQRKQFLLLKLPLFMTIYQKKGDENFKLIVNSIRLTKFYFGEVILSSQCLAQHKDIDDEEETVYERTFNYILKGSVMMFTTKESTHHKIPEFYKKLGPNQYFGQKLSFGSDRLFEVKAVSQSYILQLEINTFYNTFSGHFQYAQLKDKITFLQQIWIFSQLRRSIIQKILLMSETIKYKKNTVLFRKNQIPQKFYVIVAGQLALYDRLETQKVKFVPFCLLSRSQMCGLDQMALEKSYDYSGVVTSEFLEVLIITKEIYEEFLVHYIAEKLGQIKWVHDEKQKLKNSGIKYDKEYKEAVEYSKKRQADLFKMFVGGFMKMAKNPKIQMQKVELTYKQQLKTPQIRQFRLKQIKDRQLHQFRSSSLSTLTNKNYSKDKNILINYLMKKQQVRRKAQQNQFRYQRSMSQKSGVIKQIHVQQSTAVKNHKRKLLKSRYSTVSPVKK